MLNEKGGAIRRFDDGGLQQSSPGVPLAMLLRQLAALVEDLTDRQYVASPVGVVESSIGAHVRHCLDHVIALLAGMESGQLDYDNRQRRTDVETCRTAALTSMRKLEGRVAAMTPEDLDSPVVLSVLMAAGQPAFSVYSSVGRELAYVLSHTIHHNALVGAMVKILGARVPERFGYAPSTVAYFEQGAIPHSGSSPCAR